jgi:hypothetical protein
MKIFLVLALSTISTIRVAFGRPLAVERDLDGLFDDEPFLPITDSLSQSTYSSNTNDWLVDSSGILMGISQMPVATPIFTISVTNTMEPLSASSARPSLMINNPGPASETAVTEASPNTTSASAGLLHDSKTWKTVGVAVITVSGIVAAVFLVTFFDQWWSFLRDMIVGQKTNAGAEFLVPDWEKGGWKMEFPSFSSFKQPSPHLQDADHETHFPFDPSLFPVFSKSFKGTP